MVIIYPVLPICALKVGFSVTFPHVPVYPNAGSHATSKKYPKPRLGGAEGIDIRFMTHRPYPPLKLRQLSGLR